MKTAYIVVWIIWTNLIPSQDDTATIYSIPEGEYLYFSDFYNFSLFPTCIGLLVYAAWKIYLWWFIAWMLCFPLCSTLGGSMGAPNGSTAFLLSAFVLEGFLTSQPKTHRHFFFLRAKYAQVTALSNTSRHVHLPDEPSAACLIIQRRNKVCVKLNLPSLSFVSSLFSSIVQWGLQESKRVNICPSSGLPIDRNDVCKKIYIGRAGRSTCFLSCRHINHSSGQV